MFRFFKTQVSASSKILTTLTSLSLSVFLCGSVYFAPQAFSNSEGLVSSVVEEMPIGQYAQSRMILHHMPDNKAGQIVVLVHGIGGTEGGKFYNWDKFLEYSLGQKSFSDRFQVVLFAYDSARSVDSVSQDLTEMLEKIVQHNGNQPIRVLAYSEGGLLVRNALENPVVNQAVEKVITIATPFQGSPLANADWVSEAASDEPLYSPVRLSHRFAYWLARKKHPSFEKDFSWQANAIAPRPAVMSGSNAQTNVALHNVAYNDADYELADKKNFVVYGSYFGQQTDPRQELPKMLGVTKQLPKERFSPKNLFRKNILFTYINKTMARLNPSGLVKYVKNKTVNEDVMAVAIAEPVNDYPANVMDKAVGTIMAYNDGISPINSSLWLDRYADQDTALTTAESKEWQALRDLSGTGQARLFQAMDHRNWMDGYNRTGKEAMVDLLNPNDQPKTVFDWIMSDLMS